ncbi:OmpA family protein [Limibaculum sp. FT325]|uniref:flagellar motor protein MotB n=1 Tax=Thermohalobaculum sediminis TaxID=2939436 RepID=UPI0020C05010|nr:flagellar motor protein MotB [Limibaculum sediminis]MCL5775802.1 OmpA family protein [Limibaculum sediminis]
MANRDAAAPLIIRRVTKVEGGHHGGAWKVAYADFVTAMMAFFLLMWLLNATSEEQRKGIADYFDPALPVSRTSAGGTGMLSGESIFSRDRLAAMHDSGHKRRVDDPPPDETATSDERRAPSDPPTGTADTPAPDAEADAARAAAQAEADLERRIAAALSAMDDATVRRHFRLRVTPEGLVIEIVDLSERPLFDAGSAEPSAVLHTLLGILVPLIADTANDIALVGHTDALPFGSGAPFTNWELSADRANAARRLVTAQGLPAARIVRVSGLADTDPFDADPKAPQNRRIAVVMLREGRR